MSDGQRSDGRAGQPLVALAGILLFWIALRIATFQAPPEWADRTVPIAPAAPATAPSLAPLSSSAGPNVGTEGSLGSFPSATYRSGDERYLGAPTRPLRSGVPGFERPLPEALPTPALQDAAVRTPLRVAAGHNLLWMAAMAAMPLSPDVAAALRGGRPSAEPALLGPNSPRLRVSRWSGDGWVLLREGGSGVTAAGFALPVYGGSQAGAVVRFDLAPGSRAHPSAYVRAVQALGGARDSDLAAGLAVRPLAGLPVTAHAELRASSRGGAIDARPAAFLVTGVDDAPLAVGMRVRGYAQAGYVGGRDATAFADGSMVAERTLWRDRDRSLATGAGAWGGAQRGAARLDLGPTASLKFRLGEGAGRVAVDYRLRVAGNAEPAAGATLTLSAGF